MSSGRLYLISKVIQNEEILTQKDLSNLIIEMDKQSINLAPIVANLSGFIVRGYPQLLNDYIIYRIIDVNDEIITINHEGADYISEKTKDLSDDFKQTADKVITNYYKCKH